MHIHQTPSSGVDAPSSAGDYSTGVRVISKVDSFENRSVQSRSIQTLPAERYWALKDSVGEASARILHAEHTTTKTAYVKELLRAIGHIAQARCLMMRTPSPYGRAYCNNLLLVGDILEKADRLSSRAICQAVEGKSREEMSPTVLKAHELLKQAFQMLEDLDVVDQGNGGIK